MSDAQQSILNPDIRLVEAGPGAGKTRAIVRRFIESSERSCRGVAFLSFTNAAVSEATARCAETPDVVRAPNFIGTFDRFIHRYLVTPAVIRETGKQPRYVDSWNDISDSRGMTPKIRHKDVNGTGLLLANFRIDANGDVSYPVDAPRVDESYVASLKKEAISPRDLLWKAKGQISGLVRSGIYDSDQSRLKALQLLHDGRSEWLRQRLAHRFEEVIIDEFQDCSSLDHRLIAGLKSIGIRIIAVADPDQAIYEFRHASPEAYALYRSQLTAMEVVHLVDNYRSSAAICMLVSSLRTIGDGQIVSKRPIDAKVRCAERIHVVSGDSLDARLKFDELSTDLGIARSERIALSATRKGAAILAGRDTIEAAGKHCSSQILQGLAILSESRVAEVRKEAISQIEDIILSTFKFPDEPGCKTKQARLEIAGLTPGDLRGIVGVLLSESRGWTSPSAAIESIRDVISTELARGCIGIKPTKARFKDIEGAAWNRWKRSSGSVFDLSALAAAHTYAVKGKEYDAVLLDIEESPKGGRPHVLDLWRSGETHEAVRVLYVGASRARRLLVLATSPRHFSTLRKILEDANIPTDYDEAGMLALSL
ncbi:UvrD-helicase domain-containing protein [Nocardia bovistercoris]|uniref:UvrD-helicase domain-containing protein n=1 Tax=Nocardia bovistercoris TaxID=2785916 RepID=A0A931IG29_9NOCA|nr:UvrD-helicase domain-containing protein [Nocardia bovistercoris]MBH0779402.1 UvrD-helicase domain-containing protein [Nocardia bovistercoris]